MQRLIPAPAGNTLPLNEVCHPRPAHPRARGEHYLMIHNPSGICGSFPRPRGTLHLHLALRHLRRLIPAPAGNTSLAVGPSRCTAAHPRARGEHALMAHQ